MSPDEPDVRLPLTRSEYGLSFLAIGEGSPADASERVDEIVGDAIARRLESSA